MKKKVSKRHKDWFRPKSYPHIGIPLTYNDKGWVSKYVKDKEKIATHAFLPFIYRKIIKRKFRREVNEDGTRSAKRVSSLKPRDIYYASHLDSQIYSYYAETLKEKYELKLKNLGIQDCVTAYRRISVEDEDRNKCNIDFAKEVFDFIRESEEECIYAVAFDIDSFFDSLDHKQLKQKWYTLLGRKNLEKDHYNLFKSLTQFSYVNENQIFKEFKNEMLVESRSGMRSKKRIKRKKFLYENGAIAYCTKKQFDERIRKKGLVKEYKYENYSDENTRTRRTKGIPQGTPLSSVLANIYMLDFDYAVQKAVQKTGGLYRRYSDDMVIVCKPEHVEELKNTVLQAIKNVKLKIQPEKTNFFKFEKQKTGYSCQELLPDGETWYPNTNFEYLGFEFDGKRVLLKSSSLANYFRKMKRSVKRGAFYAKHGKNPDSHIYRKKLFKRFSHIGAGRRMIYQRDKKDSKKWVVSYKYDWGNFLSYVKLAENIMEEPAIAHQLKNHWKKLNEEIENREHFLND